MSGETVRGDQRRSGVASRRRRGDSARAQLAAADVIFTSDLTLIECDRAFRRAVATGRLSASESLQLHAIIDTASAHWTIHGIDAEVVHRSRRSFRVNRSARSTPSISRQHWPFGISSPDLLVLSLDERIRDNAVALGFQMAPAADGKP